MPQGSFNVSRLLAKLGLKNIIEMPVSQNIQATLPLNTMFGQVPVHVAGVALYGGQADAVTSEKGSFQLQCLDPGGGIIQWIRPPQASSMSIRLSDTPLTWATGPVTLERLDFTNEPARSIMLAGNVVGSFATNLPRIEEGWPEATFAPLYVPPGKFVQFSTGSSNSIRYMVLCWCGLPATESAE